LRYWDARLARCRAAFEGLRAEAHELCRRNFVGGTAHIADQYAVQLEALKGEHDRTRELRDRAAELLAQHPEEIKRVAAEAERQRLRAEADAAIARHESAASARLAGITID
jgi:hypothetical protein